jgi:hypothetical protein
MEAMQASAVGLEHLDVEMAIPNELARGVEALQETVAAADALCEEARLLTLASSPELRALRSWMTEEIGAQVQGADPVPWPEWRRRNAS